MHACLALWFVHTIYKMKWTVLLICDFGKFWICIELGFTYVFFYTGSVLLLFLVVCVILFFCLFLLKFFLSLLCMSCSQCCMPLWIVHSWLSLRLFLALFLYANVFLTKSNTYKYIIDGNTPSASAGKLTNALPPRFLQNFEENIFL